MASSHARPTDGLFFAIFPDAGAAVRIAEHAHRLRSTHRLKGNPPANERFHVTLAHLGDHAGLPEDIVEAARKAATAVVRPPFDVVFDRAVSFSRPNNRPLVLLGGDGLASLLAFRRVLATELAKAGLGEAAKERFTPHVTLLYDDGSVAEQAVEPVRWKVQEFVLVHSLLGRTRHIPLGRWALIP